MRSEKHLPPTCLMDLVEAQVDRTPASIALVDGHRRVSYQELDARANQVAHRLERLGVGPEVLVGLCMSRSAEMVIALLGILKAGGAYVPLDPAYPTERLEIVLEDARVSVLLTEVNELGRLPNLHGVDVLCLDPGREEIARESNRRPERRADARNLAYLIYTSGSTGRPKGVAIERASAVTFVQWALEVFSAEELGAVLASTSICFDLSIFELFVPLSSGGTVILASNALDLPALPAAEEVTLINTVPSAMAMLLRIGGIPNSVRTVNLAGEPLKSTLVKHAYGLGTVERVYNLYGPSEDTTYSTYALVPRDGAQEPTIGRPIANSEAYILDGWLQPVPTGEIAELYLGGAGLARGYLNRPDVTAERFVPDPFSGRPGARLYVTGDLARYLPNGEIEFLGRIDHQVKVRGFRIELGEIEVTLEQHEKVREAVVVAREDTPDEKLLAGYVVPQDGVELTAGDLRSYLKERLPEYMVPSAIVIMSALPLTPSGKVDRRALPAPDWSALRDRRKYVAPRTPLEEALAAMWADVLQVKEVGIQDTFFDLGGHSLLAIRILSRIRSAFGIDLPMRSIFEASTVEMLARCIEAERQAGKREKMPILRRTKRSAGEPLPVSFSQQSMWVLDQLEPGCPMYNIPYKVELDGPIDVDAFERSLNEIVRRHETLRTTFAMRDGELSQVIAPTLTASLPVIDLELLPAPDREIEAQRIATEEARKPIDLEHGPLFRAMLLRLSPVNHVLILTIHHIIGDDWTMGVLFHELGEIYDAFSSGQPSPVSDLPIQYADFARWQRQWLRSDSMTEQLSYWRKQLENPPAALELPTDRSRPPIQTFSGSTRSVQLSAVLSEAVRELCRQEGVTLFMTLLGAFKALIQRYTGRTDVIVGSPIAGRNRVETEGLIGLFINTLALRTDLSGDPTFRELLQRVRDVALGAYSHQDVPFEKLVEEIQPARDPSRNPLVQVMFALQNPPPAHLSAGRLIISPLELHNGSSKLDLTLFACDKPGGLVAMAEFNTDLFDHETIDRMLGHLQVVLEGAVRNPALRLSQLPLLTAAEQHRLLVDWNDTNVCYPERGCLHHLFEAQAKRTPDATAVVHGVRRMSYRDLNGRANQVAHRLRDLGVGPEAFVAIYMERSLDMIIALLGTLKAGGAYVPLDPGYPKSRIAFMLSDSQASVLVTKQHLLGSLPEHSAHVLCLDRDAESIARHGSQDLSLAQDPGSLAYLIYTSGSTGIPKAVAIEHRSAVTFVNWARDVFSDEEFAGVLASTSICFDLSVFEIFATLGWGGKVIMADNALHLPLLEAAGEVTLINTVPSAMSELIRTDSVPSSVRTINLAGEPLQSSLLEQIYASETVRRVLNLYGPSEDTTYSTFAEMNRGAARAPSIGRPIANTQTYLLDSHGSPVPQGVPGELHLGGEGLARGYLGRPDLTAERFVPNPFTDAPGARMYRTGDLARYLPDANIEFLGRIDHQVKIRGFRIELGEIESVLGRHAAVRDVVVIAREDRRNDKRLVAYIVVRHDPPPIAREMREFMGRYLPEPMVPSAFVFLPALPLTRNGKIDRQALPAPDWSQIGTDTACVAPRTRTEELLSGIWQKVLRIDRVSIHDNFFELGGHSLLAAQVTSRIRAAFGMEVPLRRIFSAPTIATLAEHIQAAHLVLDPEDADPANTAMDDREEGIL